MPCGFKSLKWAAIAFLVSSTQKCSIRPTLKTKSNVGFCFKSRISSFNKTTELSFPPRSRVLSSPSLLLSMIWYCAGLNRRFIPSKKQLLAPPSSHTLNVFLLWGAYCPISRCRTDSVIFMVNVEVYRVCYNNDPNPCLSAFYCV